MANFEPWDLTPTASASKEVNDGRLTRSGHRTSLTRKPSPPPMMAELDFPEWNPWQDLGWPRNWKFLGVMSKTWDGVVVAAFWKVSVKAKMSILSVVSRSEMNTDLFSANSDLMLRVQSESWIVGPGFIWISPERKRSRPIKNVELSWHCLLCWDGRKGTLELF